VFARLKRKPFVLGIVAGVALLLALRLAINETPVADWIIAPLLLDDTRQSSQAIVVLGAGVLEGCVPNQNGVRRALLAARLWKEGKAPVLVFTGGSGTDCPVAKAMALLAREMGVPESAIRQETGSLNTWENGAISAPLLRGWGFERLLLVTDRLHMRRASAVFTRLGFDVRRASVPIGEGHDDNVSMLHAGVREFIALGYYRLRGWIGSAEPTTLPAPAPVVAPTQAVVSTGPIVVLGASYAAEWKPEAIAGVPVINRGVAGQQSFEMLARFDTEVIVERPRAVILWGFINDIFRAPSDSIDSSLTRVRESYVEMIARARRHGIEPVLATEVTTRPPGGSVMERVRAVIGTLRGKEAYQDRINRHVLALNQWIVETGARERLLVLDFQSVLSEPGGRRRPAFAQPDGSHITRAGYDVLTSYAAPILEEFLIGR
jgi:uncharacterized SAM-binding protein YcdF (DUF218 family)/lysophospholipase L1-like esterase